MGATSRARCPRRRGGCPRRGSEQADQQPISRAARRHQPGAKEPARAHPRDDERRPPRGSVPP